MELPGQLQLAVGSAYRIERELGPYRLLREIEIAAPETDRK